MSRRARILSLMLAAVLTFGAAATAGAVAVQAFLRAPIGSDGVTTILLLGSDSGPMRNSDPMRGRADAFHALVVSKDGRHATFLNFPRDSYVNVPGMGRTKLNACLVNGPDNCVRAVEQNFDLDVDHWVLTDFRGLMAAVNRLGGIVVDVPQRLTDGGEDIDPGKQRLNGPKALTWTRDRKHRPNGDFTRSEAQAELLQVAHAQLLDEGLSVRRIAELVGILRQTTVTDASPETILKLAYLAATLSPENVDNVTMPGSAGWAGKASVVFLKQEADNLIGDVAVDGIVGSLD
ncbi:MAG: LCP family protein [Nitriliruptorales bacterium]